MSATSEVRGGTIDLHCHLLPGIDDGPPTLADSLALARAAVAQGTSTIVATPHISWEYPANDHAVVADGVRTVREALAEHEIELDVRAGGEIAMTRALDLDDAELERLRLGGGPYLLVECPHTTVSTGFDESLAVLRGKGHRILLAHPERCPALIEEPESVARYAAEGMVLQLTAGSLAGRFGPAAADAAMRSLRAGHACLVASDAHRADGGRSPATRADLEAAGLAGHAQWLLTDVPRAVLEGTDVPRGPAAQLPEPPRAGLLRRLLRRRA